MSLQRGVTLNCDAQISNGGCDAKVGSSSDVTCDAGCDAASLPLAKGFRFLEKSSSPWSSAAILSIWGLLKTITWLSWVDVKLRKWLSRVKSRGQFHESKVKRNSNRKNFTLNFNRLFSTLFWLNVLSFEKTITLKLSRIYSQEEKGGSLN